MKTTTAILFSILISFSIHGQNIVGQWNGALKIQGTQLRLVFNITDNGNGLISTMDSPDQGAKGIPTTTTSFENSTLKITIVNLGIEYTGELGSDNIISGIFKQGNQSFPMNLSKEGIAKEKSVRPQEPTQPYQYLSEDIIFENTKAGITLAGTLTLPEKDGVFPAVILISGSGPQNRDEELLRHKPFLVISDYLTRNGIAVFRYDDRGTALSKGDFGSATSADFATDALAAVEYLKTRKEIDKKKIGLIGHSEGGLIAPMVANESKNVAFIVLLAGTGIQGDSLLLLQQRLIGKASGMSNENLVKIESMNRQLFAIVNESTSIENLRNDLTEHFLTIEDINSTPTKPAGMSTDDFINLQIQQLTTPWMQFFIKYNPAPTLEKVKCPVLAINGEKDLQVPPKENLEAIASALKKGGNKNITIKELPNLNHLFQESQSGSPSEYAAIEQTFSPSALTEILKWIQIQTK